MNGTTQDKLILSLRKIQTRLCAYANQPCDCKFIRDEESHAYTRGEGGSGCPELLQALELIRAMTSKEFNVIRQRANISIFEIDREEISASLNKGI